MQLMMKKMNPRHFCVLEIHTEDKLRTESSNSRKHRSLLCLQLITGVGKWNSEILKTLSTFFIKTQIY